MESFLLLLSVFAFGYIMGWLGHAKSIFNRIKDNPDDLINLLKEYKRLSIEKEETLPAAAAVREIKIEKIDKMYYLYAKDNGQFLAQSTSIAEALEIIEQRFPGEVFQGHISTEEAKRMGLSN